MSAASDHSGIAAGDLPATLDRLAARDLLNAAGIAFDARTLATVARLLPVIRKDMADRLRSECDVDVDVDLLQLADRIEAGTVGTDQDWTVE